MEKIYHIYAGNNCLLHSIPEEEFAVTWKTLNRLVGIVHTAYTIEDLSYEELSVNDYIRRNSSY